MANLGDQKGALESAQKALAIREKLAALQPRDAALARELSATYLKTSELLWLLQKPNEALGMARKQIETAQAAAGPASPADSESRRFLADAYAEHGWMQIAITGNAKALIENERKAVALLEPLIKIDPADQQARYLLAHAYGLLAGGLSDGKETRPEALHLYREALRISESLSAADPTNAKYNKATAGSYNELGTFLERAVAAFDSLPGPPSLQIRYGKAKSQSVLAKAYERTGKPGEAVRLYRRAVPELKDLLSRGLLQGAEANLPDEASAALRRLEKQ